MIVLIPARTVSRLDTLASEDAAVWSVLITDRAVSIGLTGEISNRITYGPDELVPVRGGIYEAQKLRGGYPNGGTLREAYGLSERADRKSYGYV
jgi:hypothetical protein